MFNQNNISKEFEQTRLTEVIGKGLTRKLLEIMDKSERAKQSNDQQMHVMLGYPQEVTKFLSEFVISS